MTFDCLNCNNAQNRQGIIVNATVFNCVLLFDEYDSRFDFFANPICHLRDYVVLLRIKVIVF